MVLRRGDLTGQIAVAHESRYELHALVVEELEGDAFLVDAIVVDTPGVLEVDELGIGRNRIVVADRNRDVAASAASGNAGCLEVRHPDGEVENDRPVALVARLAMGRLGMHLDLTPRPLVIERLLEEFADVVASISGDLVVRTSEHSAVQRCGGEDTRNRGIIAALRVGHARVAVKEVD